MDTTEIAKKLVEMCREGKIEEVKEFLFADDVISIEPREGFLPRVTKGMEAIRKKAQLFIEAVEYLYGHTISKPVVAGNYFSIAWHTDIKMKGEPRKTNSELCLYEVKNGKIISEQFFY